MFSPTGKWLIEEPENTDPSFGKVSNPQIWQIGESEFGKPTNISISSNPVSHFNFSENETWLFASEELENEYSPETFESTRPPVKSFIWDMRQGLNIVPQNLDGHRGYTKSQFSHDAKWLATIDAPFQQRMKVVRLWNIEKGIKKVLDFETEAPAQVLYPMFDPQNKWFILGKGLGADFYSLEKILSLPKPNIEPEFIILSGTTLTSHWNLHFSPDAHWLVNEGNNNPLKIWKWSSKGIYAEVDANQGQGEGANVVFTNDGNSLITSAGYEFTSPERSTTMFWKLDSSQSDLKKASIPGGGDIILHNDQQNVTILNSNTNGDLDKNGPRTWTIRSSDLVRLAEKVVARNMTLTEWNEVLPSTRYEKAFPYLPTDVSVIRSYVDQAIEAVNNNKKSEAEQLLKTASQIAIESKNPFAAISVARAGLDSKIPHSILDAAIYAATEIPNNPDALEVSGEAMVKTGNSSGETNLKLFNEWKNTHSFPESELRLGVKKISKP